MIAIYQKNEQALERVGAAAGLALLVYISGLLALYPAEWRLVVPVGILLVGCASLPSGYLLTVAAIAWPLATLSIYFAALFLALAIIPMWYALHNIWAVLLIAAAPFLSGIGLGFVAPLAAGLLMSRREGVIVGGGSYFSLWLVGALTYPPDTAHMGGPLNALQGRFGGANSFETIGGVLGPLNPNSSTLLNNILHLALWAAAGYLCAVAADWGAQQAEQRARIRLLDNRDSKFIIAQVAWHALLPLVVGGAVLTLGLSLAPALLNRPLDNIEADLINYGSAALWSSLLTLAVWLAMSYLHQPVSVPIPGPSRWQGTGQSFGVREPGAPATSPIASSALVQSEGKRIAPPPAERAVAPGGTKVTVAQASAAPRVVTANPEPPSRPRPDEGERVIMIEID